MMADTARKFVSNHRDFYSWLAALYADPELTPAQKVVGARIALHLNLNEDDSRKGQCNPAVETLRKGTALTTRGVQKARDRLVAFGWIVIRRQGGAGAHDSNSYDLAMTNLPGEIRANGGSPISNQPDPGRVNGKTDKGEPASAEGRTTVHPNFKNYRNSAKLTAVGAPDGAAGSRGNHLGTAGARLEKRLGKDAFGSWFGSAAIIGLTENVLSLSVPTKFLESWIRTHYADAVIECWRAEGSPIDRVEIEVRAAETRPAGSQHGARAPPAAAAAHRRR